MNERRFEGCFSEGGWETDISKGSNLTREDEVAAAAAGVRLSSSVDEVVEKELDVGIITRDCSSRVPLTWGGDRLLAMQ
jgi:hypothetical protein